MLGQTSFLVSLFKTQVMAMKNATYYNDGLYIKDGRLVNYQMEPGRSGIEQASMYRKQMKKQADKITATKTS